MYIYILNCLYIYILTFIFVYIYALVIQTSRVFRVEPEFSSSRIGLKLYRAFFNEY